MASTTAQRITTIRARLDRTEWQIATNAANDATLRRYRALHERTLADLITQRDAVRDAG